MWRNTIINVCLSLQQDDSHLLADSVQFLSHHHQINYISGWISNNLYLLIVLQLNERSTFGASSQPAHKKLKSSISSSSEEGGQFPCDKCEKVFNKQSSLARHRYEHSGKSSFILNGSEHTVSVRPMNFIGQALLNDKAKSTKSNTLQ